MALSVTTYAIGPDVFLKANEGNHRADGEIIGSVLSIVRVYEDYIQRQLASTRAMVAARRGGGGGGGGAPPPRRIEGWRSVGSRDVFGPTLHMLALYFFDLGFFGSGGSSS